MKIHWDDRGLESVPKSYYVTMKQAALAALRRCFEMKDLPEYEVSISFVADDEMREMNMKYREQDKTTDVLSFPMMGTPPPDDMPQSDASHSHTASRRGASRKLKHDSAVFPMGDIAICTQEAARRAEEYGHSLERELAFLVVHGVLHLLGLDHETDPADGEVMEEIQENILEELGLSRGAT
ncbi:MAG: rRNA maturation RNase YbeY [Defluviitaleaceae bacterium]|nr:rRNA maturation RNase YbeY [Defluviitaleaceae bacterium]